MSTVKDEYEKLKIAMNSGKGEEHCTPAVIVRDEIRKRTEKPRAGQKVRTTFVFPVGSNEFYRDLNRFKDRVIQYAEGNKAIGIELLIRAWREITPEIAKRWIEEGHLDL